LDIGGGRPKNFKKPGSKGLVFGHYWVIWITKGWLRKNLGIGEILLILDPIGVLKEGWVPKG